MIRWHFFPATIALLLLASLTGTAGAAGKDSLRDQAVALNLVTGSDPIEGQIRLLLEDKPAAKKLVAAAVAAAKEKNQPFKFNGAYILGRVAQDLKDVEAGEVFFRICIDQGIALESGRKLFQGYGGLIDLYYDNKKYDEAVKVSQQFLELKGNPTVDLLKPAVQESLVQALTRSGKVDDALKLVDNLVDADEEGWYYLQLRGWVLREAGRTNESARTYESVLERIGKDKTLKKEQKQRYIERTRYLLTGVYVEINQIDKATDHLKGLLDLKPDDPTYNNDLGYIWADHDMNLEEAEKLIRKAIDEDRKRRKASPDFDPKTDKDNAAFLDSMGWVLFKQKKYKEAKQYLLDAVKEEEGRHLEIYDHLGDVHVALGEKEEALAAYKKGLEAVSESKRDQKRKDEVEKKIKTLTKDK